MLRIRLCSVTSDYTDKNVNVDLLKKKDRIRKSEKNLYFTIEMNSEQRKGFSFRKIEYSQSFLTSEVTFLWKDTKKVDKDQSNTDKNHY